MDVLHTKSAVGVPPIRILGFSSIGIESQDVEQNTEAIYTQHKKALNIGAGKTKPPDEFGQNKEILKLAVSFLFMFGGIIVEGKKCAETAAPKAATTITIAAMIMMMVTVMMMQTTSLLQYTAKTNGATEGKR